MMDYIWRFPARHGGNPSSLDDDWGYPVMTQETTMYLQQIDRDKYIDIDTYMYIYIYIYIYMYIYIWGFS